MTEGHFTPDRAMRIVLENKLTAIELEHLKRCSRCNAKIRALAALANVTHTKIAFEIPASPDSN